MSTETRSIELEFNSFLIHNDKTIYSRGCDVYFNEIESHRYSQYTIKQMTIFEKYLMLITSFNMLVISEDFSYVIQTFPYEDVKYYDKGYFTCLDNQTLYLITPDLKINKITSHEDKILSFAYINDKKFVISTEDKKLFYYYLDKCKCIDTEHRIKYVSFSSLRNLIFACSNRRLILYNMNGSVVHEMNVATPSVHFCQNYFLTIYGSKLKVWNIRNYDYIISIETFDEDISMISSKDLLLIIGKRNYSFIILEDFIDTKLNLPKSPRKSPKKSISPSSSSTSLLTLKLLQQHQSMVERGLQSFLPSHLPSEAEAEIWEMFYEDMKNLRVVLEFPLTTSTGESHYYDFYIQDEHGKSIILEYDGLQHFFKVGQREKDFWYMNEAITQGYSFIRFAGLFQLPDWKTKLKNAINETLNDKNPKVVFISDRYISHYQTFKVETSGKTKHEIILLR